MSASRPRLGIILTGGGARAAYQVGVLRAIAELVPRQAGNPFPVICGTSAGAINAVALAADSGNFRRAVLRLHTVWKNFHAGQVYRADPLGVLKNSAQWIGAALTGGLGRIPIALLDNSPLRQLLTERVQFEAIQRCIDAGHLGALAITCSGYTSGQSVCFYQGGAGILAWKRARRIGMPSQIQLEHLLASSALPFIFPAVRIHREYFGDGSMRELAPLSPAIHLGSERVLVISVGGQTPGDRPIASERVKVLDHPTLAQIAGHALDSIFLDSMEADLERLQRINKILSLIPPNADTHNPTTLRHIDFMVISPSEELERIAIRHVNSLPRTLQLLYRSVGATQRGGSKLLSYLLFEKSFCRELLALGYRDAMACQDNLRGFLGQRAEWYCELRSSSL